MFVFLFVVIKCNPASKITETNEMRIHVILSKFTEKPFLLNPSAFWLTHSNVVWQALRVTEELAFGTFPLHKKQDYAPCETSTSHIDDFDLIFHSMLISVFLR